MIRKHGTGTITSTGTDRKADPKGPETEPVKAEASGGAEAPTDETEEDR